MAKIEEEKVEEAVVEDKKYLKDEAHVAFRKLIEAYEKRNPAKFAGKKEALEKKFLGKLAFGINPNDGRRDGSIVSVN